MKKFTTLVLSIVMGSVLLAGCAKPAETTAAPETTAAAADTTTEPATEAAALTKLEKIKAAGKIVLVTSADYPPFEYHIVENGKDVITGFDIDIAKDVAKDLGVELEIQEMNFDGLLPALAMDKADFVIAGMNITEERKQSCDFTMSYYTSKQAIIINAKDADNFNVFEDFKGKKVAVQKTSMQETYAKEYLTESVLEALDKVPDEVLSLKAGKVDCVVVDHLVGLGYTKNDSSLALAKYEFPVVTQKSNAICIKKGEQDLVDAMNKTLERIVNDGTVDQYIKNHSDAE